MSYTNNQSHKSMENEYDLTAQDLISKSIPTKSHIKMIEIEIENLQNELKSNKKNLMIERSQLVTLEHKKVNDCKTFITDFINALDDCRKLFLDLKSQDESNNFEFKRELSELKAQRNKLGIDIKENDLMMDLHEDGLGNVINVYKIK